MLYQQPQNGPLHLDPSFAPFLPQRLVNFALDETDIISGTKLTRVGSGSFAKTPVTKGLGLLFGDAAGATYLTAAVLSESAVSMTMVWAGRIPATGTSIVIRDFSLGGGTILVWASSGAYNVRIGGTTYTAAGSFTIDVDHTIVLTVSASAVKLWADGVLLISGGSFGGTIASPWVLHRNGNNTQGIAATSEVWAIFAKPFPDALAQDVSANPWQLFYDQDEEDEHALYVQAGSSATASPAGTTATASVGAATARGGASVSATGTSASSAVGTVAASGGASTAATGVAATSSIGAATSSGSAKASPAGQAAAASVGTSIAKGSASAATLGASATASVGTATASSTSTGTATVTGVAATAAVGSAIASGAASVAPLGISASATVGTPAASGAGAGAAAPAGVSASGQVGTAAARGNASIAVAGASTVASVGQAIASGNIVVNGTAYPAGVTAYGLTGVASARDGTVTDPGTYVSPARTVTFEGLGATTAFEGFKTTVAFEGQTTLVRF